MLANYWVFRGRALLITLALAVMMMLANQFLDRSVFSLFGHGSQLPAYVGLFICGIMFSYFYHGVFVPGGYQPRLPALLRSVLSLSGILILIALVLLSIDLLFDKGTFYSTKFPGWFSFGAGLVILFSLITPGSLLQRTMSFTPLRALGVVGFSFYLIHPYVISLVVGVQNFYYGYTLRPYVNTVIT